MQSIGVLTLRTATEGRLRTLPTRSAGEGWKRDYASQRQSNSGESGGGDRSGVQPVNFSINFWWCEPAEWAA